MAKEKLQWTAEKRRVSELRAWEDNPRKITKQGLNKLKERITTRGFHDVIKIDVDGTILSGNQRKKALLDLGISEVTVLVPSRPLSKEERDKVALESNSNDGSWDLEKLKSFEIGTLSDVAISDLDLTSIWDKHLSVEDDEFDEEAELRKIHRTDIRIGDKFALGRHTLLCSDALDPKTAKNLMGDVRADMVNDDMPFNIDLSYDKGVSNKAHYGGTTKDNKTDEEYRKFVRTIMQNAISVCKPDCHLIFWTDERNVWIFQTAYKELGVNSKRLLIWIKNNSSMTPGSAFNKVTEFAVYGTLGQPHLSKDVTDLNEVANKEFTTGNSLHEEILDQLNIWMVKRLPSKEYLHPTQKSPTLHEKALRRCTRPGDVVLDLTAGSGSILSACEQLKRTAYLAEIEPIFCQLIINRFRKQTGIEPIKLTNYEEN